MLNITKTPGHWAWTNMRFGASDKCYGRLSPGFDNSSAYLAITRQESAETR